MTTMCSNMNVRVIKFVASLERTILKEGAQWIAQPITRQFSMPLNKGNLPKHWISANITPIFKKEPITDQLA